jgi:hypothetical protein
MPERFVFPVRYEPAAMRAAVNAFTLRALVSEKPALAAAPLALIALSCAMLAYSGDGEDAALLFLGALAVLAIFVGGGWRMHQRAMREKIAAARGHISSARLFDDGIVIDAGGQVPGGAPLLEWKSVKAVWPAGPVLLLILASRRFVALPIDRAPREAVEFLMARVAAA